MNAKIIIIPLTAALVGGCAWLNEQPYYIPGGSYVQRIWVPRGGYVEDGRQYYYDGGRRYYIDGGRRYYFDGDRRYYEDGGRRYYYDGNRRYYEDGGRRHYIDELRREAREEREFIKDVGKAQMKREAAKINLKRIAKDLAESCVLEDASQMRRDFPFSFIALPWESSLNK